jgi:hypothetical protein
VGTPSEQLFDDFARLAAIACDTPVAVVTFIDEQRVWFKAKIGLEVDEIPRQGSFCFHAILQGDVTPSLMRSSQASFKLRISEFGSMPGYR